jgi:hypothetical protein
MKRSFIAENNAEQDVIIGGILSIISPDNVARLTVLPCLIYYSTRYLLHLNCRSFLAVIFHAVS